MDALTTKEKIMDAAARLFSDKGYDCVSMRDIAAVVGIQAASIYNHFPSKRDILLSLYEFYVRERGAVAPDIETVLPRLETESIYDVARSLEYYYPPSIQDMMDRIMLIASQRICLDEDSEQFVQKQFFEPLREIWVPLLNRAIELDRIEPVDVEAFTQLISYYAFSTAELNKSVMKVSMEQWQSAIALLLSLLKPISKMEE
uniref:Transcriptional regulator, TetR/AcrR family n=1 Tax=uncultured bacterium contig00036 TaxID=1181524 RepID=A0A806KQF4_9BACT|nr:transcriptional regulator, TetR/AcrR family [uncultured bacterium contig00036]